MAQDGKIVIGTKIDETGLNQGYRHMKSTLSGFKTAVVSLGLGVALSKATSEVSEAFGSFDSSLAKASTLFGSVAVDTDNLSNKIFSLAKSTGITADQLNQGLYQALSAGVPVTKDMGQATEFLSKAAKLAKAGFTDMPIAIEATAKTLNAYGMSLDETDRVQNILIKTQNLGITTVDELGRSLSNVTPIASSFGVSFENIGAALALMTAKGTPTAEATTQLRQVISELGKDGTEASKALAAAAEAAGLPVTSFKDLTASGYDLGQILSIMSEYAGKSNLSILDLFSSIEAGQAALAITSDLDRFNSNLEQMESNTDAVSDAYSKMADAFDTKKEKIKVSINTLFTQIGKSSASSLNGITDNILTFLDNVSIGFGENGFIGIIDASISELGKLLPKMFNWGVDALQSLTDGIFGNIDTFGESLFTAFGNLIATVFDRGPQLLDIGKTWLTHIWDGIKDVSATFFTAIGQLFESILQIWDYIDWKQLGKNLLISIWNGIVSAWDWFWGKVTGIWDKLVEFFSGGQETVTIGVELEADVEKKSIDNVNELVATLGKSMKGAAEKASDAGIGLFDELVPTMTRAFSDAEPEYEAVATDVGEGVAKAAVEGFDKVEPPKMGAIDFTETEDSVDDALDSIESKMEEFANTMTEIIAEQLTNAIGSLFEQIGAGEATWSSFAKAGLMAIAAILDALARQLTASAVLSVTTKPKDWDAFARGMAGASAASAGAGLIRGYAGKFATGGMVGGSYTGKDDQIALVQAGELILNRTQTQNMAALLNRLDKGGVGSGSVVINFNGDVYGDKEQIAMMVYEKQKMLIREGRLAEW